MSLREAAKAALEALHIGASAAESIAEQYHEAMKGYRQARHDALDADVRTIRTAIEGISAALAEADPMQCEHCGIQFPDKQPGSLCPKCHREVTRAEAEKAEPVAWYLPFDDGYDSLFRDHRTVMKYAAGDWSEWIPLYAHPPAALPESAAWTPVTTRRPPWNERKVVCYTEGNDYGGSRFITMPASDFHCYDEDDPDEPGSRESKTVSHWIYEDDLIAAARGKG